MNRCKFFATALAAPLATSGEPFCSRAADTTTPATPGWRTFAVATRVSLRASTGPA